MNALEQFAEALKSLGGRMGRCKGCEHDTLGFVPYETPTGKLQFAAICLGCDCGGEYPRIEKLIP